MALPAVDIHGRSSPLLLVLAEYVAVLRVRCKLWTYAAEVVHACVRWPACALLLCTNKQFSYLQWKRAAQPSGRPLQTTDTRCSLLCFVLSVNCTSSASSYCYASLNILWLQLDCLYTSLHRFFVHAQVMLCALLLQAEAA